MRTLRLSVRVHFLQMENSSCRTVQWRINYRFGKLRLACLVWATVRLSAQNRIAPRYRIRYGPVNCDRSSYTGPQIVAFVFCQTVWKLHL